MSELLTRIRLRGHSGGRFGQLDWGVMSHGEMVAAIKDRAASEMEAAKLILAASPHDFDVDVVRGSAVQHFVRNVPLSPEDKGTTR